MNSTLDQQLTAVHLAIVTLEDAAQLASNRGDNQQAAKFRKRSHHLDDVQKTLEELKRARETLTFLFGNPSP